ncbi:CBS domain-containing protein [Burkholderia sola]
MNAAMLCTRDVAMCSVQTTVVEAAAMMRDTHAGDLVVVREREGRCEPVGMLTDRDIVLAVVGPDAPAGSLFVGDIMSAPVAVADVDDDLWLLAAAALLDELRLVAARQPYFEEKQRG